MEPGTTLPSTAMLERLGTQRFRKATLPGVRMIEPLSQGDYDGLCGLYCIINAIRLVLAPHRELTSKEVRSLFSSGIKYIDSEASLSRAVRFSVGRRLWPSLAERLSVRAQAITGIPLILDQPLSSAALSSPQEAFAAIENMIRRKHAPMAFMRGKYRHYSVVCGYTPVSLRLFDSYGYRWVRRASCGRADCPKSLHRFHMASLIAVRARG